MCHRAYDPCLSAGPCTAVSNLERFREGARSHQSFNARKLPARRVVRFVYQWPLFNIAHYIARLEERLCCAFHTLE